MKGYLRTVEALIAVIMILGSFQIFLNWSSSKPQSLELTKATIEDLLRTHADLIDSSYYDTGRLEKVIGDALPKDLNYKLEAEYFIPIDILFPYREQGTPYETTVDFGQGVDSSSITVLDKSELVPHQVFFNWYRIPFFLLAGDEDLTDQTVAIAVQLPYMILNGNVVKPDPASLDLYVNSTQKPFALQVFNDTTSKSNAVLVFNLTLPAETLINGFLYFSGGSQVEKNAYSPNLTYTPSRTPASFTYGQGSLEKVDRGQLILPLKGEFYKPKFLVLDYKVQTPQAAVALPTTLTSSEDANYFLIKNDKLTVNISKSTGEYSVWVDGLEKFKNLAPTAPTSPPKLLDQNPSLKMTVTWDAADGNQNVTYFVSLFNSSNEVVIQRRITALSTTYSIQSDTYQTDSNFNKIYLVNETAYDGNWLPGTFDRALPWIVAYNSATNESVGFLFDKPTSIRTQASRIWSQTSKTLEPSQVTVDNIHMVYTPPSGDRNYVAYLYQLRDGLVYKSYSWNSQVGDLSAELSFPYVVPSVTPTIGKLRLNLEPGEEDFFGCTLNDHLLFNTPLLRNDKIEVLFLPSWLKNQNSLRCYTDRGTVLVKTVELFLAGVNTADRAFESLFWNFLPLTFTSNYTEDRNVTVGLNHQLLGLSQFNESFVVLDANGYILPFSVGRNVLTFNTTVPACCNKPSLHYLLFSDQPSKAFEKQIIPASSKMENFYSLASWGNDTWPDNATVSTNQKTVHVEVLRGSGNSNDYYDIWWNVAVQANETPYLTFKYRVNRISGNGLFIRLNDVGSDYVALPTANDGNWHILTIPFKQIAPSTTTISKIRFAVAASGSGDYMDYEIDWIAVHGELTNLPEDLKHSGGDLVTLNSEEPIKLDLGITGKVNKKTFYLPAEFNFKYDSTKVIADGQDTVSVRRYVFDSAASRAAILKLTVWRRA